ncbi:hypothetical protein BKA70DRAFT_1423926 [Coprinopsis sp. MPI-PUGE-AT-0042]|nr:hypothetical protein BKA70DRAFT_1423926 [Coprinopsis sp. MPI-PUGE-AT-0042]
MHIFLVVLAVSLASVAHAEDVTLFEVSFSTSGVPPPLFSNTLLGISRLSVDEAGATHYVYSRALSWFEPISGAPSQVTRTFKADATRVLQEVTTTLPGDMRVQEERYECIHHDNGTSTCRELLVMKQAGTTATFFDVAVTGTPTPWITIKGVESAVPTGGDEGGANRSLGHINLSGFIVTSLGVGFAQALM